MINIERMKDKYLVQDIDTGEWTPITEEQLDFLLLLYRNLHVETEEEADEEQ